MVIYCKNVFLENITCQEADYAWYLDGYEEIRIRNIFMRNICILKVENPLVQKHAVNFSMENVRIGLSKEDLRTAEKVQ